jgi:hypothetical protein
MGRSQQVAAICLRAIPQRHSRAKGECPSLYSTLPSSVAMPSLEMFEAIGQLCYKRTNRLSLSNNADTNLSLNLLLRWVNL